MAIINGFDWAENRSKLERAIKEVTEKKGDKYDENDVKIVYKRLKGFVIGEDIRIPISGDGLEGLTSKELYKLADQKKKEESDDEDDEKEKKVAPKKSKK